MPLKSLFLFAVFLAGVSALTVLAQDEPIAAGLNGPRHITYADDGALFIVERRRH